ncbi:MAG: hypothetical protein H6709_22845 [Kofleriaceae bacterium]|nr:hypothetical protein [Kofleriaceae bacterium]MCB9574921.1 hypothetical protein [Kofleriaceae bacterium]
MSRTRALRWRSWLGAVAAIAAGFVAGLLTRPPTVPPRIPQLASSNRVAGRTTAGRETAARVARPQTSRRPPITVAGAPDLDMATRVQLGTPLPELFASDPRDEAWATPLEQFYKVEVADFLATMVPEAADLAIECRTSICKIDFVVPNERVTAAFSREQALPFGDSFAPWNEAIDGDPDHGHVGVYVFFTPETRTLDEIVRYFREQYAGRFAAGLDALRAYYDQLERERAL